MGSNITTDEFSGQSSDNGHDPIYYPANWRDSVVTGRPKALLSKRSMIFLSIDVMAILYLIGIIDKLNTWKEITILLAGVLYLLARMTMTVMKLFVFASKNSDSLKKGWKSIKDIINE